jgi:hypothetical protein
MSLLDECTIYDITFEKYLKEKYGCIVRTYVGYEILLNATLHYWLDSTKLTRSPAEIPIIVDEIMDRCPANYRKIVGGFWKLAEGREWRLRIFFER